MLIISMTPPNEGKGKEDNMQKIELQMTAESLRPATA
jgi:hypothetical protein